MALPAHLVERFSPALVRALRGDRIEAESGSGFSLGALDAVLPDSGFLRGGVVELSLARGVPGTSLVLAACQAVQASAARLGSAVPWCVFVDPTETLHAPGVAAAGVRLDRLLVVRPPVPALSRTALCLAKSAAFELVIVDLIGVRGAAVHVSLNAWPRLVRRLALEVDGSRRSVVLLTDSSAPRSLPLPVAQRIEIERPSLDRLVARVAKDRRGLVTPPRPLVWARPERSLEVPHASTG
jgi:hypothetical protein